MGSVTILGTPTFPTTVPNAEAVRVWSLSSQHGATAFFNSGVSTAGFVIPAGVSLVEAFLNLRVSFSSTATDARVRIRRNGTTIAEHVTDDQSTVTSWCVSTGMISVAAGDIIDMTYETFGSGTQTLLEGFFGLSEIDRQHAVVGRLASDFTVTTTASMIPLTIEADTSDSWINLSRFLVPEGADVAFASVGLFPTAFSAVNTTYQLLRNGVVVRQHTCRNQNWMPGPCCFGPVAVVSRDVLEVRVFRASGTQIAAAARGCRVSVEFMDAA